MKELDTNVKCCQIVHDAYVRETYSKIQGENPKPWRRLEKSHLHRASRFGKIQRKSDVSSTEDALRNVGSRQRAGWVVQGADDATVSCKFLHQLLLYQTSAVGGSHHFLTVVTHQHIHWNLAVTDWWTCAQCWVSDGAAGSWGHKVGVMKVNMLQYSCRSESW